MSLTTIIYIIAQCTWGLPQTLLGFIIFMSKIKNKHYFYHGAVITEHSSPSSISLGLFVFVSSDTATKIADRGLLVHEYGHTIQSLIFGPLYLIVMGIPSFLWAWLPYYQKKRAKGAPYAHFFTERFANYLGEKVTGEKSFGDSF